MPTRAMSEAGTVEAARHEVVQLTGAAGEAGGALRRPRLEPAIGVIYRPETERESRTFAASVSLRFDALGRIDRSRAVEPLKRNAEWLTPEPPETSQSAL